MSAMMNPFDSWIQH